MSLRIGDKAPDFTLHSLTPADSDITLSSYRGKNVVLLFFPMTFTGGCTAELCTIAENYKAYDSMNAVVLGISVDGTFPQKAFAAANNLTFPLLSDFNKEVTRKYDVLLENFVHGMNGVSARAVYVIDNEGTIKYVEVTETPGHQPDFSALKDAVSAL